MSVARESQPLSLNWSQGGRPINDNFADAVELSGESGEISGSNLGATLEVGELYGYLSSTVWYRWIAPADGQWEFQIEDAEVVHLLAFVGDDVGDLRLVTSIEEAGEEIYINAKKDQTYHLMVASPDAYSGGWTYDSLTWREVEGRTDRNDMFVDAMDFGNGEKGRAGISHNSWPGIEPDEPESTGVQSRWWKWAAPTDGQFTFFWTNSGGDHVVAAFSGSSVSDLQSVMLENDSTTENEFVVEAQEGEEYRISIGMQRFAATAFQERWKSCNLRWGPTPSNNTIQLATELSGSRGEAFGSLLYATTEQDGWSHLGQSAVWYEHEVEEAGWVRFWIESSDLDTFRLAAFESSGTVTHPELIMTSKRHYGQRDHVVEVYVLADSGMRVLLRVANDFRHRDADFTLRWEATDAPNWLTYVGRLSYGRKDDGGNISRIRGPAEISFNGDGTAAYVTTQDGLHVYQRNAETGGLTFVEVHRDISGQSHHIWDSHRSRLYVHHEFMWQIFALSSDDSVGLAHIDSFNDDNRIHRQHRLGVPRLTIGGNGDYLYRLGDRQQRIYDFSTRGNLQHYGTDRAPQWSIFPSSDGRYWNGLTLDRNLVSKNVRIPGSPFYEWMSDADLPIWEHWVIRSDHYSNFVFVSTNTDFRVYDNQSDSEVLKQIVSKRNLAPEVGRCGGIFARKDRHVVDLICDSGGFVVEYDPDSNDVHVTDMVVDSYRTRIPDRFGRTLPRTYYLWRGNGVSASPDGRHIYASTRENGVLIFERYGNDVIDLEDTSNVPISRLDLLQIEDGVVWFGDDSINDGCFESNSWNVDDITYSVVSSRWQERQEDFVWKDVEGSSVNSQLCVYEPEENREYRIVADIEIDRETNEYSSNFFARLTYEQFDDLEVSSGEIELNGRRFTYCVYLSDTDIEGKNYTVFNSKWQSRPDEESPWADVDGTETSGELCPLDAEDGLEYRLVGSIMVDGDRGHRRSNVMRD